MSTPKIRPSDYPFAGTPTATPRTDAAWAASFSPDRANFSVRDECEKLETELETEKTNRNHLIEKGAKLETELAAMKAEFEKIILLAAQAADRNVELRRLAEKAEAALAARDAEYMRGGKMLAESAAGWQALAERAEAELAAERERVRVLRSALERRHDEQSYYCQYVEDALAATKEECERIKVIATEQNDIAEQHRRELAHLRAESDRADVLYQRSCEVEHKLRAENDEMRVQIEAHKGGSCQCADDEACAHVRRAERAEAECLEQARLLGKSGEREADLLGKLERAEAESVQLRDQLAAARQREAVAIASWDEERGRALREGARVVELKARAEKAEAALTEAIDGVIDGGSIPDTLLVIHIPRSPVGYRVGQPVKVILPAIDAAMKEEIK